MISVVVSDSGLVAAGWIGWIGGPYSDVAIWTSDDGIVWSLLSDGDGEIGNGVMWSLINTARGLLAVGTDGTDARVWEAIAQD